MKQLLPCFQALLLVFLLVGNATAQEESPKQEEAKERDVSKLSPDELQSFAEFKRHTGRRYRRSYAIYHPVLSRLVAEGTEEEADKILSWWWHGARGRRDAGVMSELLIKHHSGSAMLEKFVPRIRWAMESEKAEALLRRVLEASSVDSVKATTSFSLLELLVARVETVEGKDAELLETKIASLAQSIKKEYTEFTDSVGVPYGERLEGIEFSRQLVAGNPVPDIVGSDLDGVEFKLSDYKGNVVLISFWGQW